MESLDDQSTDTKTVYNWTCFATVADFHGSMDPAKITPREHAALQQTEPHTNTKASSQEEQTLWFGAFLAQLAVMDMENELLFVRGAEAKKKVKTVLQKRQHVWSVRAQALRPIKILWNDLNRASEHMSKLSVKTHPEHPAGLTHRCVCSTLLSRVCCIKMLRWHFMTY